MTRLFRMLVVGTGSIGERHVRCLLSTGRALVGICEPIDAVRARVASGYSLRGAFADLDSALSMEWDSAVIATPAHTHIPLALRIVRANASPLIEKPLAVGPEGIVELAQAAKDRGLPVGVAYIYRAHPALRSMRQAVCSGRWGRPIQISVVAGQHFPTHRPAYASTYYAQHRSGGGAIQDALTHSVNACEWLVGPVTRLAAGAAHRVLQGVDVEDTVSLLAWHGDVLATYSLNQHQAPNETTITVVCERGTARFDVHQHAWRWLTEPGGTWADDATAFASHDQWFIQQEESWLQTLAGQAPPLCTLEEGFQTLRVNQAALASAANRGQWQDIQRETWP